MTVPPVSNQRQTNSDCSIRQTRSSSLLTQAYNSNHFYMVRLVWFPGYVDWERRKRKLRANADVRGARSFAQCVSLVPSEARLYPRGFNWDFSSSSSSSSSSTGSWPKNFDISTMVYGITIRLAGMKALAVTKQLWANCVGSPRETDAAVRYPQNTDFSRTVGTTATKLTGMTVPPVSNPRQTNSDCTIRQTRSLFLPTQAYNSGHFYMVRLVWFPGYMDWESRNYTWEIREQTRTFAERCERGHLHNV